MNQVGKRCVLFAHTVKNSQTRPHVFKSSLVTVGRNYKELDIDDYDDEMRL